MAKVVIEGTPYELDVNYTFEDNDVAKHVAGLPVWKFGEAWDEDRPTLALALAAIVYKRANPQLSDDQIRTLLRTRPLDKIVLDFTEDEEETPTPTEAAEPGGSSPLKDSESSTDEILDEHGVSASA